MTVTPSPGIVLVAVSVFEGTGRLDATLTFIAVFADSSLPGANIRNRTAIIATPNKPSGIKAHGGKPERSRCGCVTTILSSATGCAANGRPQFGQATAEFEISCPDSLQ